MDPGPEKHQQGDQLEAHSVALPADGTPTLEEHQDDGKDLGKVWSNVFPHMSDTMVSGGHGEESTCSSPPQSVDCATSSSLDEVGNDCASSSSGSSTTSSSEDKVGNDSTTSSSEDEVGNDSTTSSSLTVDRAYPASQLLEILPPNFKYIWNIRMAQTLQESISQLASLESTHGLDKPEEPILSPDDSRPIGISQRHQVGLVGNVARGTSVTGMNRKRTKDSDSEEEPPAKKMRDTVAIEELSSKRTRVSDDGEEELPSKRTREGDDAEEELPSTKTRDSGAEEEPVLSSSSNTLCEDPVLSSPVLSGTMHGNSFQPSPVSSPSKGTGDSFQPSPVSSPSKGTGDSFQPSPVSSPSKGTGDSFQSSPVSNPSPMTFWLNHINSPFSISSKSASEDAILSSPDFSPSPTMPSDCPIMSFHPISSPVSEDSVSSSPILSYPQMMPYEDPFVSSSPVVSPSPSTYCKIPSLSFPCMCVFMKSQTDREEEPTPSTSGIGSNRRVSSRQVWFRPRYDFSSDSD